VTGDPNNYEVRPFAALEWRTRGACVGNPPHYWYSDIAAEQAKAIRICNTCPVIDECKSYALGHREYGIWGGITELARRRAQRGKPMVKVLICSKCHGQYERDFWALSKSKYCSDRCRKKQHRDNEKHRYDMKKAGI